MHWLAYKIIVFTSWFFLCHVINEMLLRLPSVCTSTRLRSYIFFQILLLWKCNQCSFLLKLHWLTVLLSAWEIFTWLCIVQGTHNPALEELYKAAYKGPYKEVVGSSEGEEEMKLYRNGGHNQESELNSPFFVVGPSSYHQRPHLSALLLVLWVVVGRTEGSMKFTGT